MHARHFLRRGAQLLGMMLVAVWQTGAVAGAEEPLLPLVHEEDFESADAAARWQPSDAAGWKIAVEGDNKVYSQFKKQSPYKPPYRSPLNFSLLKDVVVGDFVLTARCRSTHTDYGHRDMCLFFGYQDPAHFYYVHLGKQADAHANQIFIVNSAPRTKVSTRTTPGTPWDDEWHDVKIVRDTREGKVEVYFDDMKTPVMTANDTAFTWGQVGIGSFDDTGNWDDVKLYGVKVKKPSGK